ncbi:MAG TPA: hypothetical protein VF619_04895 [Allosphingosinicella sp.]|jgi:hypothetical protein
MISYDPKVIQEFADSLYSRADGIIMTYSAIGALLGLLAGYMVGGSGGGVLGVLLGLGIGYWMGTQRAFLLKLQAQQALCQVQIERNTGTATAPAQAGNG